MPRVLESTQDADVSFGELPFITSLYEQARSELDDEGNLSIDGIKQLLMTARTKYLAEMGAAWTKDYSICFCRNASSTSET